ncbi:hypothetical protein F4818DRAFT_238026 [Hypoxylon cercidicola]|nr:hypothetical protein F4818DRAFT_238026 [Hypoxylon cercidicola]
MQMWHFNYNQTSLWDEYIPSNEPNHLFFDTSCQMQARSDAGAPTSCINNCFSALTGFSLGNISIGVPDWRYPFIGDHYLMKSLNHTLNLSDYDYSTYMEYYYSSAFLPGSLDLSIEYCLAEPLERICHIGLSPTLLTGVTICVIIKTCTAIIVTITLARRKQTPLVTLGDAIASFVENPDPVTAGLCTFGQDDARRALRDRHIFQVVLSDARRWQPLRKRRGAIVPVSVWLTSYLLFAFGIAVCATAFGFAHQSNGFSGSFFESDQNAFADNPFTFFEGVMTANSPQLLLSFCYLAYNNLFTRLQMAREWALFSEEPHPLRVTDPQGEQYATYRLQLPYKYSLPLIAVSIFLHWLLSNMIYLFVSLGGYYGEFFLPGGTNNDPSLPPNTAVAVGFSTYSIMGMLVMSCVLITIPILLSLKRLSPNTVNIGTNSFALSAACHVSRLSRAVTSPEDTVAIYSTESSPFIDLPFDSAERLRSPPYEPIADANLDDIEMEQLVVARQSSSRKLLAVERLVNNQVQEDDGDDAGGRNLFRNLARSKIRWGVVHMPPEWYAEHGIFEHLSFGAEEDNVQAPVPGRLYA